MARLRAHALEPRVYCGVGGEIEAALVGNVRVGVQRDVRDRVAAAHEEVAEVQVALHQVEAPVEMVLILYFLLLLLQAVAVVVEV